MKEKELERALKAVANKRRLVIIRLIKKKFELPVGEIARSIKLSYRSTSKHLSVLSGADILEKEQRSLQMFYKINKEIPNPIRQIISLLC